MLFMRFCRLGFRLADVQTVWARGEGAWRGGGQREGQAAQGRGGRVERRGLPGQDEDLLLQLHDPTILLVNLQQSLHLFLVKITALISKKKT